MKLDIVDYALVICIVLKLVGVVTWSWPIVLIPLWIAIGIGFIRALGECLL